MHEQIHALRADALCAYDAVIADRYRPRMPILDTRDDVHDALAMLPSWHYADGSPHPVEIARVALARLLVAMVDTPR